MRKKVSLQCRKLSKTIFLNNLSMFFLTVIKLKKQHKLSFVKRSCIVFVLKKLPEGDYCEIK